MEPLRKGHDPSDADAEFGATLLAATRPFVPTPAMQRRVRARIATAPAPGFPLLRTVALASMVPLVALALWTVTRKPVPRRLSPVEVPIASRYALPLVRIPTGAARPSLRASVPITTPAPRPARRRATGAALHDEAAESQLVIDAMRLLRAGDDRARAAALLERYMSNYPSGALAEEALALSIEAAHGAAAIAFAQAYLARYPQGRYAAAARAVAK